MFYCVVEPISCKRLQFQVISIMCSKCVSDSEPRKDSSIWSTSSSAREQISVIFLFFLLFSVMKKSSERPRAKVIRDQKS